MISYKVILMKGFAMCLQLLINFLKIKNIIKHYLKFLLFFLSFENLMLYVQLKIFLGVYFKYLIINIYFFCLQILIEASTLN